MTQPLSVVLCSDRNPQAGQEDLATRLAAALQGRPGLEVTRLPHLYDLAPNGPGMGFLRSVSGPMVVLAWLYPRATFWALDANGVRGRMGRTSSWTGDDGEGPADSPGRGKVPDRSIWCLDLRQSEQPEVYVAEVERILAEGYAAGGTTPAASGATGQAIEEATRARWYPVVDYGRCTGCLECLNFCLFGVYGLGEGDAILVEQPDACRNGCPACARVCPEGAIMFPQHKDPAIGGDPRASRSGLKLDLSQLFGGTDPAQLAALERQRALAEKDRGELDRLVDGLEDLKL